MRSRDTGDGVLTFVAEFVVVGLCIVAVEDVGGNVGSLVRENHGVEWRELDEGVRGRGFMWI